MKSFRSNLNVLVTALLTLVVALGATAAASTVIYSGQDQRTQAAALILSVDADATATGEIMQSAPRRGELPGWNLQFVGTAGRPNANNPSFMRVEGSVRQEGAEWDGFDVVIAAQSGTWRSPEALAPSSVGVAQVSILDPVSKATVYSAELEAVGTVLRERIALDDDSVIVSEATPFFYDDAFSSLRLGSDSQALRDATQIGLDRRRSAPAATNAAWWDEREVEILTMTQTMVSTRTRTYAYSGGSDPVSSFTFGTWVKQNGDWTFASLCSAMEQLDRGCDTLGIRYRVLAELRNLDAPWARPGENVNANTPWLLDTFTILPGGIRFDYGPGSVGPAPAGTFTIDIPWTDPLLNEPLN